MPKRLARNLLIGLTLLWLAAILPCGWLGVFSVFLTDSGEISPVVFSMIFYGLLGFPVLGFVCAAAAWILYRQEKNSAAVVVILLPLLELTIPIVGFILLT